MNESTPQAAPVMLGSSFMSRVRAINPKAEKLDLRSILDFPDNRDQLPEMYGLDFPARVRKGSDIINPAWYGKPVAIIGAGAAGLCAAYEVMRTGLTPVIFEMQDTPEGVRHGGRAHSYNFSATGDPPAFGELGCMRFPKSHTTLRTYVNEIFKGEYHYGKPVNNQWPSFIDPLLIDPNNKVVYDTAFYARGINGRKYYRVNQGTAFTELPDPIQDVSAAFDKLLFDETSGILTELVHAYANNDSTKIKSLWIDLNKRFQDKSIFEVLRDHGWEEVIKGTNETSRLSIFGELGLGSGGFDAFWGTTFMEILRIKIHEDEINQDAFVGCSSYMLSPFITHEVECADKKTKSLGTVVKNHIIGSPVIEIRSESKGGVRIVTEGNETGYLFPCAVLTVSPTAISSSIVIDEDLLKPKVWDGIRNIPLTGCGKIFIAFPTPFWKGNSKEYQGRDAIVTTVTDEALRQVYAFDDYHWGSGSSKGVLMLSYTWGDWAHKMGSLSSSDQVQSAIRMLKEIYSSEWKTEWDTLFDTAIKNGDFQTINWSHERGFAGGYRMADLNRYPDQSSMWDSTVLAAKNDAALFLAGEASAWLGLSGWVEGALHTGLRSSDGVANWFRISASTFSNWDNVINPGTIDGKNFAPIVAPGEKVFNGE